MKRIENISSVSDANWLNILPDLQQKKVLKIGTDSIDIIKIISYCNVASLSCIGMPRGELQNIVNEFYQNEEDIREKFDVVIFDQVTIGSISKVSDILNKITEHLNEAGVLLVCCPDGWRNLKYRYVISKVLQAGSKEPLKYYICNPSAASPHTIIPYINEKVWTTYNYPNIEEETFNNKIALKGKIKEYIFRILGRYNPFSGLIIVLSNTGIIENIHEKKYIESANEYINDKSKEIAPLVQICIAYHYSNKHYLFYYSQLDKKINHIKKIEYKTSKYGSDLEKEYKNLLLFKEHIEIYDNNRIVIPQAVYLKKLPDRHESSMTVVKGVSLKYLVDKYIYKKNNKNVIALLDQVTDMQICFQKLTENNLKEVIYNQDPEYYLNYLGLDLGDINIEVACIQHCDFAANNIHLDTEANKWGVIDWEGLAQGMPAMLDLFSMFTSFRFTMGNKKYKDFQGKYYDAIIDTYFSDNWISRCILKNLKKYCLAFKIPEEDIYGYFVLFLIFQSNKYRILEVYDYQLLFEEMLRYAIENKDKFIA